MLPKPLNIFRDQSLEWNRGTCELLSPFCWEIPRSFCTWLPVYKTHLAAESIYPEILPRTAPTDAISSLVGNHWVRISMALYSVTEIDPHVEQWTGKGESPPSA